MLSLFATGCAVEKKIIMQPVIEDIPETEPGRLTYYLRGEYGMVEVELNQELREYLGKLPREYYCSPICPPESQLQLRFLDEKKQRNILDDLANKIKLITDNSDDRARIAVSLVQRIPYDTEKAYSSAYDYKTERPTRYPYSVIYDNKGICEEKSRLLAFLLRELGYGVVLFGFDTENHMAVGIKCAEEYSYKNTGYCYVETTAQTRITESAPLIDASGNIIEISSMPRIIMISEGKSFTV